MFAARFHDIKDIRVERVQVPSPGPGEVLIRVAYAGICGSDLHIYNKGMFITQKPVIMGHEFSGIIEKLGDGVINFKLRDHVIGDPRVSCRKCPWCGQGEFNLCPALGFIGEVQPGCFAEYIVLDSKKLFHIPNSVKLSHAALIEPLAVALHIVKQLKLSKQCSLGIVGAGPIGLLTAMVAKLLYACDTTVVDIASSRLDLAKKIGVSRTLNSIPEDDFVDAAVEAVGKESTLNGIVKWVKPKGKIVMAGLFEESVNFDPNDIVNKELRINGINAYSTEDLKEAINIIANDKLDLSPLITNILPLKEINKAFELLTSKSKKASKILLAP